MTILGEYIVHIMANDQDEPQEGIFKTLKDHLFPNMSVDPAAELTKLIKQTQPTKKKKWYQFW
jgi:hypothetical protein